jgi:hypothetical protein
MLNHSSHDIAAAALLTALRAAPSTADDARLAARLPTLAAGGGVGVCAARMWDVMQSGRALPYAEPGAGSGAAAL